MIKTPEKVLPERIIVGLIGRIACGKSTAAKFIKNNFGAFRVRFSDVLRQIADESGEKSEQGVRQDIWAGERIKRNDDTFLPKETFLHLERRLEKHPEDRIVVEGMRMTHDVEEFRRFAKTYSFKPVLIYIDAAKWHRFDWFNERLKKKGEPTISIFKFNSLERNVCEAQIEGLRSECDVVIENSHHISEERFLQIVDLAVWTFI